MTTTTLTTSCWRNTMAIASMLIAIESARAARVNLPETWDGDLAGWTTFDLVNEKPAGQIGVDGQSLRLTYKKQSTKTPPEEYLIRATGGASGGRFAGNYLTNGITAIAFRLFCEYHAKVSVCLYNEQTGRLWRYRLANTTPGQWMTVEVPVDLNALRNVNGVEGWTAFKEDLQNVSWAGVSIERNSSMNAQSYRLDDFQLKGVGPTFGAWINQFTVPEEGTGSRTTLPGGDLDADGASNYGEWIAGTSAGDGNDCLAVALDQTEDEESGRTRMKLTWNSVAGKKYSVWRSTDLRQGFAPVRDDIDALPPQNFFTDPTATNNCPYFYKLQVRDPNL